MWARLVFVILAAALWCGVAAGEEAEKLTFKGKVADMNDRPVTGAMVRLYEGEYSKITRGEAFDVKEEQKTKEDGGFSFDIDKASAAKQMCVIIAEKEGFAFGWDVWYSRENTEATIKLGEPNEIAGTVLDTNGQPIADAEVGIYALARRGEENKGFMSSIIGTDFLKTRTDEAGKFVIKKIPSGARVEFAAKKAGKAITTTATFEQGNKPLKYETGQRDLKIVMPAEAVIEGRVVEKETQKGVAGVKVTLDARSGVLFGMLKPVESGEDGTFRMNGLSAGKKTLLAGGQADKPKEWVAEPVEVTTEDGKTTSGVEIKVSKGGLLEVVVTEAGSKKPISQAQVSVRGSGERQYFGAQSDSNGLAQIRLTPGEYVIDGAYHKDYSRERTPTTITIEEGKTTKVDFEMNPMPKIRGVVRDSSGKPMEGAECRIYPMMNTSVKTDANGRFEMAFNKQSWGGRDETFYAVVLAKKENLAWTGPVEEEVNQMEIKLTPALVYTGKVVDANGAAIAGAKVTLMARFGSFGSPISDEKITSDKEGRFELKYIPEGLSCSVSAQASGYSKEQVEAEPDNIEDGRVDMGEFQLKEAPLTVTGIVVDINDVPAANVRLFCYGQRQPERSDITTDTNGRFTIDKVCEGELQISANTSGEPYRSGQVRTEGGATDVKIVISEQGTGSRPIPKKSPSITGKAIPAMDGFGIKPAMEDINDKPLLICFFDVQQRPSRHTLKELAGMTAGLKEKGIAILGVQSSPIGQEELDEQLKKAGVTFAVGMIGANEEKVKSQWGIDGLPWFILTNKQHIVKSSGFVVGEIAEKLEGLDK